MRSRWMWWMAGAVLGGAAVVAWPWVRPAFSGGAAAAAELLARTGRWGPLVVVGLQTLQAVISPLPSWPVTVAAGAQYGAVAGTLYSLVGGMVGAAFNFLLARRLGKALVARKFGERWVKRVEQLGPVHFLVLSLLGRLIPIASFDVVAYVAGISRLSLRQFLAVALVGQAPAFFAYAWFGSDLAAANRAGLWSSVLMLLFLGLILAGRRLWQRFVP